MQVAARPSLDGCAPRRRPTSARALPGAGQSPSGPRAVRGAGFRGRPSVAAYVRPGASTQPCEHPTPRTPPRHPLSAAASGGRGFWRRPPFLFRLTASVCHAPRQSLPAAHRLFCLRRAPRHAINAAGPAGLLGSGRAGAATAARARRSALLAPQRPPPPAASAQVASTSWSGYVLGRHSLRSGLDGYVYISTTREESRWGHAKPT